MRTSSGPAVICIAHKGRTHDRNLQRSKSAQINPCVNGAVHTRQHPLPLCRQLGLQHEWPIADCPCLETVTWHSVSIHAPTKRATPETGRQQIGNVVSIHAPTRRATGRKDRGDHADIVSIHAPTRRATLLHTLLERLLVVSIHAPTRRATAELAVLWRVHDVSIHAPTRRTTFRD